MSRRGKSKPEFQPTSQTYIDLIDSTANLEHILSIIQRRWGSEYTIVTTDGLPLEDSPATQGLAMYLRAQYVWFGGFSSCSGV